MAELDDDEKAMFLEELGIEKSGLDKLVQSSYHLLDLISFLTAGEPEVRAGLSREERRHLVQPARYIPTLRRALFAQRPSLTTSW